MAEVFSSNREYDFIRQEGLYRVTGRPAHEWDIYILKELIDNALDADELLWYEDLCQPPSLRISMEYIRLPPPQSQQLIIRVQNRALFPVEDLEKIFSTRLYTSRKTFLKSISRGALGNALKTLLGIPYALHYRSAGDWKPSLKPLSIRCQGMEYSPRYRVDSSVQTIDFELGKKECKFLSGTTITIGLDYFVQEVPRILKDIQVFAQQYHFCNPHAEFSWFIDLQGEIWEQHYQMLPNWSQKFHGLAPVQWYSLSTFKDLLGALCRQQNSKGTTTKLQVEQICRYFADFLPVEKNTAIIKRVIQESKCSDLTKTDIESALLKTVYTTFMKYSSSFQPLQLGAIGQDHISQVITANFQIEGKLLYARATNADSDPETPFVLEAAIVFLKEGKRELWTAINFSPTYNDPFLSRWLQAPAQPESLVLGLRGFLDVYGFTEETPALVFLHLICPTIEYNEFSKTDINHLPFKKAVGSLLDQLLTDLRQQHEEEEIQLERKVFQELDAILAQVKSNERFIPEQLLERLQIQLSQDRNVVLWLQRPGTRNRLRLYLLKYQDTSPNFSRFVARAAHVALYLPSHPDHYISMPVTYALVDIQERYNVNKILYIQHQELTPVILDNNWLCRMDIALLHASGGTDVLEEGLSRCIQQCELPVLVLHDATDEGYALLEQFYTRLNQRHLPTKRLIDLQPARDSLQTINPMKLMTGDLEVWLLQRFAALKIASKCLPLPNVVRKDIRVRFEQLLRAYLFEHIGQYFTLDKLLIELSKTIDYTKIMMNQELDERVKNDLMQQKSAETYTMALDTTVHDFFKYFVDRYGYNVRQKGREWIRMHQNRKAYE